MNELQQIPIPEPVAPRTTAPVAVSQQTPPADMAAGLPSRFILDEDAFLAAIEAAE